MIVEERNAQVTSNPSRACCPSRSSPLASSQNLTTNEHANLFRYKYLHDSAGRFRNPWNQGMMGNLYERFSPSRSSYELGMGNMGEEEDLLANAV